MTLARLAAIALIAAACTPLSAQSGDGWLDLLPGKDFAGWKRVPIKPLADKAVWSLAPDGKTLVIDGVGATEMLLYEKPFADGTLHVEWRFRRHDDPKFVYNGGVYVRTALDGKHWVQAQVARQEKPPIVGDLMGILPGSDQRVDRFQKGPSPEAPLGEWNAYDITCKGGAVELVVNGKATSTWSDCPLLKGHIGLQAEFAVIEVRAFRFKPD